MGRSHHSVETPKERQQVKYQVSSLSIHLRPSHSQRLPRLDLKRQRSPCADGVKVTDRRRVGVHRLAPRPHPWLGVDVAKDVEPRLCLCAEAGLREGW